MEPCRQKACIPSWIEWQGREKRLLYEFWGLDDKEWDLNLREARSRVSGWGGGNNLLGNYRNWGWGPVRQKGETEWQMTQAKCHQKPLVAMNEMQDSWVLGHKYWEMDSTTEKEIGQWGLRMPGVSCRGFPCSRDSMSKRAKGDEWTVTPIMKRSLDVLCYLSVSLGSWMALSEDKE